MTRSSLILIPSVAALGALGIKSRYLLDWFPPTSPHFLLYFLCSNSHATSAPSLPAFVHAALPARKSFLCPPSICPFRRLNEHLSFCFSTPPLSLPLSCSLLFVFRGLFQQSLFQNLLPESPHLAKSYLLCAHMIPIHVSLHSILHSPEMG